MLYLGIDQHRKQLTVNLRNELGDVLLKRQVSTEWLRVRKYLKVCGFNDWLVKLLKEYGCRELILIQPEKRSKKKTDRRDANTLGEILWLNRTRTINKIKHVLRKHNLEQECPTKGIDTIKGKKWLVQLALGVIDRLEMDQLLAQWQLWDEQIAKVEAEIKKRQAESKTAAVLATIIWHMVKHNEPYTVGGPPQRKLKAQAA